MKKYKEEFIAAGISPDFIRAFVKRQYPGDLGKVAIKGLIQNSRDNSINHPDAVTKMHIWTGSKTIRCTDMGTGMPPSVLREHFVKIGSSLKLDPTNAAGGAGTDKSAFLGNAETFALRSVAYEGEDLIESIVVGSGEDYLTKGLKLYSAPLGQLPDKIVELLPEMMQDPTIVFTGTDILVHPIDEAEWDEYSIYTYVNMFVTDQRLQDQTVEIYINEVLQTPVQDDLLISYNAWVTTPAKEYLHTLELSTCNLKIYATQATNNDTSTHVVLLNRGLPQENNSVYLGARAKIPFKVVVDIIPKVGAKDIGYPWRPDRSWVIDTVDHAIKNYIRDVILTAAQKKESENALKSLKKKNQIVKYNPAAIVDVSGQMGDTSNLASSNYIQTMAATLSDICKDIKEENPNQGSEWDFGGFFCIPQQRSMFITANEDIQLIRNQVLINPWQLLEDSVNTYGYYSRSYDNEQTIEDLSKQFMRYLFHAICHSHSHYHDDEFVSQLENTYIGLGTRLISFYIHTIRKKLIPLFNDDGMQESIDKSYNLLNTEFTVNLFDKFSVF